MRQADTEAFESGGAAAALVLIDWLKQQDAATSLRGFAYVSMIAEVTGSERTIQLGGMISPDYWSMELAAAALAQMAAQQGFVDAAVYCEQARQEALQGQATVAAYVEMRRAVV